jgi:hypothetical protein
MVPLTYNPSTLGQEDLVFKIYIVRPCLKKKKKEKEKEEKLEEELEEGKEEGRRVERHW